MPYVAYLNLSRLPNPAFAYAVCAFVYTVFALIRKSIKISGSTRSINKERWYTSDPDVRLHLPTGSLASRRESAASGTGHQHRLAALAAWRREGRKTESDNTDVCISFPINKCRQQHTRTHGAPPAARHVGSGLLRTGDSEITTLFCFDCLCSFCSGQAQILADANATSQGRCQWAQDLTPCRAMGQLIEPWSTGQTLLHQVNESNVATSTSEWGRVRVW